MSSDIITNLHLDDDSSVSKIIVAKELNGCDSSFIVNCVLGHCIKNGKAVLIVSNHNSILHHQNIGLKMNINLQKHIDSELIQFYNLGEGYVNSLLANEDIPLEKLYLLINSKLSIMIQKHGNVNIVFDGVSHLFDLQFTLKEVNAFCNKLIKLVRNSNKSFGLFHCNVAHDDDVTYVMSNLLTHQAYTVVEVENLSSGWSADVSGHLTIKHPGLKFQQQHMYTMDTQPSHYLFKLFDRGVKLFAPGTV